MTDGLHVVSADGKIIEPEHPACRLVRQPEPSLLIDDDDPFDHAGEDRRHLRLVAIELGQTAPELLNRSVQRSRHVAKLVGAVAEARRAQIADGVAPRHFGDSAHARSDSPRHDPRDRRRADQRQAECQDRQAGDRPQLAADARERKRHTHDADARMSDRDGDVEHVDVQRVAVAARSAETCRESSEHFRPRGVVFHRRDLLDRLRRIANHAAIGGNQRHARIKQAAHPVGLIVQGRGRGVSGDHGTRQELRGETGFSDERLLDPLVGPAAH